MSPISSPTFTITIHIYPLPSSLPFTLILDTRVSAGIVSLLGLDLKLTCLRAILIQAAMVGYDQSPTFELYAPHQRDMTSRIEWEIRHGKGILRRAVEADGLLGDWEETKAKL